MPFSKIQSPFTWFTVVFHHWGLQQANVATYIIITINKKKRFDLDFLSQLIPG